MKSKYEELYEIAKSLTDFKDKCYARMGKGDKDYDDFIMSHAPCNYNLNNYKKKVLRR